MIKIKALVKKNQPKKSPPSQNQEQRNFASGVPTVKDLLAPSAIEVDFNHLRIDNKYFRSLFVAGYPRFVNANWLSPLINFDHTLDTAMFIYPVEIKGTLDDGSRNCHRYSTGQGG